MSFWDNFIVRRLKAFLPDWTDPEETRLFFVRIEPFLEDLAEATETKIDDLAVDALGAVTNDPAKWAIIHGLLFKEADGSSAPLTVDSPLIASAANETELSPAVILLIVQLAAKVFSWWRNRN